MRAFAVIALLALCLSGCALFKPRSGAYADVKSCTPEAGYEIARKGKRYRGGCPESEEKAFLTGYVVGKRVYWKHENLMAARKAYSAAVAATGRGDAGARYDADYTAERLEMSDIANREDAVLDARRRLDEAQDDMESARVQSADLLAGPEDTLENELVRERDALAAAHAFARASPAIDHCTDNMRTGDPQCAVVSGARLVDDSSGEVCAEGKGELRYLGGEARKIDGAPEGSGDGRADIYAFYKAKDDDPGPAGAIALVTGPEEGPQSKPKAACAPVLVRR